MKNHTCNSAQNNGNQIILRTKTEKEEIKIEIKSDVSNLTSEI